MLDGSTYRHLETPLRIGELSVLQWALLLLVGAVSYVLAFETFLPVWAGATLCSTLVSGTFVGIVVANTFGVRPWTMVRWWWEWRNTEPYYNPGPGADSPGYLVTADDRARRSVPAAGRRVGSMSVLWDSQAE